MKDLQGKVAVITGAGSGIGAGIARSCAKEGMKVVVSDINLESAQAIADELKAGGAEAIAVQTDVSKYESVEALAKASVEAFGTVHLLCNNAGVWLGSLTQTASLKDWQWLIDINVYGVIHGVQAFLPILIENGEGHIVNTASLGGLISGPPEGLYATSKYAVVGMSETLAYEVGAQGIGVSILCPGLVKTNIIALADEKRAEDGEAEAHNDIAKPQVDEGMCPDEVGRRVIDGVVDNEMYIITHNDHRDFIKMRFDNILDSMDRHAERYSKEEA